jgi:hypothetical protein
MKPRLGAMGLALLALGLTLIPVQSTYAAGFSYKAVAFLDTKAPGGGTFRARRPERSG